LVKFDVGDSMMGDLRGCRALKFDSCNNLMSSVHIRNHAATETVLKLNIKIYYYFIHSFIQAISIAPLHYYSEALPTQHGYCAGVSHRSATCNCK